MLFFLHISTIFSLISTPVGQIAIEPRELQKICPCENKPWYSSYGCLKQKRYMSQGDLIFSQT